MACIYRVISDLNKVMTRFLICFVLLACCGVTSARAADEAVRAAQKRLAKEGFYLGAANGTYDSNTSAAVSRYQIRNGLPITGKLDAETAKSLGLTPIATTSAQPNSETWRRLRKSDQQFLKRLEPERAPPAARDAGYSSLVVLSPERLRDYVGAFVLAGLDPQVGAELEFFADRVRYYNDGVVGREKIRRDLQRYSNHWPERRFWLAGEVKVEPQPDSRLRVAFPLRYELHNQKKRSSGLVIKTLTVEVVGEDLQIVEVNERKA